MQVAQKPVNEEQRVKTLNQLDILNGQSEERFDRITRVVAALFNAPVALVNMITSETQQNKACFGMKAGFITDRSISFCSYTILNDEPLIIEDAKKDERFKDNPQVTGGLNIRAYAGVPLRAIDGTHPGALCLIDTRPRKFFQKEIDLLIDLAAWAEIELNSSQLRQALTELENVQRSADAEARLEEMARMNDLMIGRELKMAEMKEEIAKLKAELTTKN